MRIHFTMVKPEPESERKHKPNGKGHVFEEVPKNYLARLSSFSKICKGSEEA